MVPIALLRLGGNTSKDNTVCFSVNNFAIRTLIQAVGRICRTGLKNPDIYIYVDNTILTDYDLSVVEQRMLNPEFAELVKVGKIRILP